MRQQPMEYPLAVPAGSTGAPAGRPTGLRATRAFEPEPVRTQRALARDFQENKKIKTNFIFNLVQAAFAVKAGCNYLNKLFRQVTTIHLVLPLRPRADLSTTGGKSGILAR